MSDLRINIDRTVQFLVQLLNTHSPTGYHVEAMSFLQTQFESLGLTGSMLKFTNKGALLLTWPGESSDQPVGITAHTDTLGYMVKEMKPNGRLKLTPLGGMLWNSVESSGVTIRTHDDRRYRGTLAASNTSVHVNREVATAKRDANLMEVRIDARTTSEDETRNLGIEVGDFVFVDPRVEVTDAGFVRSHFLDDKAGVAAIYGALAALQDAGRTPAQDTYVLISNYEEVGHGGAAGLPHNLAEVLAVDMGALGEGQAGDEFSVSICVKDAGGPYHFDMINKLRQLATTHEIPYKVDIYPYYASDGTAYWHAGGDAKVGLVGPGVDASHAYERTHQESIENTAHLLARYMIEG